MILILVFTYLLSFAGESESLKWKLVTADTPLEDICPETATLNKLADGAYNLGANIHVKIKNNGKPEKDLNSGCKVNWDLKQSATAEPKILTQKQVYSACKKAEYNREIIEELKWSSKELIYSITENKITKTCKFSKIQ